MFTSFEMYASGRNKHGARAWTCPKAVAVPSRSGWMSLLLQACGASHMLRASCFHIHRPCSEIRHKEHAQTPTSAYLDFLAKDTKNLKFLLRFIFAFNWHSFFPQKNTFLQSGRADLDKLAILILYCVLSPPALQLFDFCRWCWKGLIDADQTRCLELG